jgi:hypothetical protein
MKTTLLGHKYGSMFWPSKASRHKRLMWVDFLAALVTLILTLFRQLTAHRWRAQMHGDGMVICGHQGVSAMGDCKRQSWIQLLISWLANWHRGCFLPLEDWKASNLQKEQWGTFNTHRQASLLWSYQ